MNREQRQALRLFLESQGYERHGFTNDIDGTGAYTEDWRNMATLDSVVVHWGPRVTL